MQVRLIGPPQVLDGHGGVVPVRGHQVLALLTRVLLAERPMTRRELSRELFPETADPLGTLRWCLAALRRALDAPDFLTGDPLVADLPPHVCVDVVQLDEGAYDPVGAGELLEGVEPRASSEFDLWLLVQRHRVAGQVDALLRRQAMTAATLGEADRALALAETAARRRPLDEGAQILLVACLRGSGHHTAAEHAVAEIETRFRDQLGVDPTPALRNAARSHLAAPPPGVTAGSRAAALLDAGEAALGAGAVDAGIESLRQAGRAAEQSGDRALLGRSLRALGAALVHSVRSHDDEGALLLQRAAVTAEEAGDATTASAARRELGYVDALAGRRPEAQEHLSRAQVLAGDDQDGLAAVRSVRAFNLADWGRHEEAVQEWGIALDLARASGNGRRLAWGLGLGGWGRLRAGDVDAARAMAHECLEVVERLRWISFRPWPAAVLAEAGLRADEAVGTDLEQVFSLSCQLADPCWEAGVARVMSLHALRGGDPATAMTWADEARSRATRETDVYAALLAEILALDLQIGERIGDGDRVTAAALALVGLGTRGHMPHHVVRALEVLQPIERRSVTHPASR